MIFLYRAGLVFILIFKCFYYVPLNIFNLTSYLIAKTQVSYYGEGLVLCHLNTHYFSFPVPCPLENNPFMEGMVAHIYNPVLRQLRQEDGFSLRSNWIIQ